MGQFSWKTSDTKRSIHSNGDCGCGFPVAMILPDNSRFIENHYEGYGEFGGKDIFEVVAELNGKKDRSEGLDILEINSNVREDYKQVPLKGTNLFIPVMKTWDEKTAEFGGIPSSKEFEGVGTKGYILPKLALNLKANYDDLDYPENCADQGWVCIDEDEDEEANDQ